MKAEAAFKIAFAPAKPSVLPLEPLQPRGVLRHHAGRRPVSTYASRHHCRTDSTQSTPSNSATRAIVAQSDSCLPRTSPTFGTARSFGSGGYLLDVLPDMTPAFPRLGPPDSPGRLTWTPPQNGRLTKLHASTSSSPPAPGYHQRSPQLNGYGAGARSFTTSIRPLDRRQARSTVCGVNHT